jgi:hypothetical protein
MVGVSSGCVNSVDCLSLRNFDNFPVSDLQQMRFLSLFDRLIFHWKPVLNDARNPIQVILPLSAPGRSMQLNSIFCAIAVQVVGRLSVRVMTRSSELPCQRVIPDTVCCRQNESMISASRQQRANQQRR